MPGQIEPICPLGALTESNVTDSRVAGAALSAPDAVRSTTAPLSSAQQRMWILERLEPGNPTQNLLVLYRIDGPLDVGALGAAMDVVVARHAVLLVAFTQGESPLQEIRTDRRVELSVLDAPEGVDEASLLERLVREEARTVFDLARDPLLRARLVRFGAASAALVLTMHHIVSDGDRSFDILIRELTSAYEFTARGHAPSLAPLRSSYFDFIAWEAAMLGTFGHVEKLEAFWRERLNGSLFRVDFPTDGPRPPRRTFRAKRVELKILPDLAARLEELGAGEDASLFAVLLAAFAVLLHRCSRQNDLVIGWPAPGRPYEDLRGTIGYFGNPLLLRSRIMDLSFREAVRVLQAELREAQAHWELSFERIVNALDTQRDLSRHPLYQVMFDVVPSKPTLSAGGCTFRPCQVFAGLCAYDMTLFLEPSDGGLCGALDYNADLFGEARMQRASEHYLTLLERVAAFPDVPVRTISLLSEEESRLLDSWSVGAVARARDDVPPGTDVLAIEHFEQQVKRTPHAVAAVCGRESLSFDALDRRANQIAHQLQRLGVGRDVIVGICVDRTLDLPTAILATWKAGGAFLPLDASYPRERLAFLLKDADARVILTTERLIESLPATGAEVVCLDWAGDDLARLPERAPKRSVHPCDLAYIIHTSGSTGTPKGVAMIHRCLAGIVGWQLEHSRLRAPVRTLQFASLNFDICYQELFVTWAAGGSVVLISDATRRDPALLLRVLNEEQIARLYLPFIALQQLARVADQLGLTPSSLREVITAGEQLQVTPELRRFFQRLDDCTLHNQYGPSECHVVTIHDLEPRPEVWPSLPPIGRPMPGIRIYLLDEHFNPTPIGVPGEVYLGGAGLARGYLARPAETAAHFVPDPFGDTPGARLYRTGDLARFRNNGELDFLGRIDLQTKIRGFRIEPGEIEVALGKHPAVCEACVRTFQHPSGERRLVAYVARDAAWSPYASEAEQIERWRAVWDTTYRGASDVADATFNLAGWNSSVQNAAISGDEMREWVDVTVRRIRELRPSRVLELGCGTGLLLHRLAPSCSTYVGTDLSDVVICALRRQLDTAGGELRHVRVETRAADDFDGLPDESFDVVVLNSVTQLFPGVDYLRRVIDGSLRVLTPDGTLFVGDVQNHRLAELLHTSVVLAQAPLDLDTTAIRSRVRQRAQFDEQLYVDPALFHEVCAESSTPAFARVELRRGCYWNEMSCYRYDVVIRRGEAPTMEVPDALDWTREGLTIERIERLLTKCPRAIHLRGVPNARTADAAHRRALLAESGRGWTAARLRAACAPRGCDPERFWELADGAGYDCHIDFSFDADDGRYDVLIARRSDSAQRPALLRPAVARGLRRYANDPLAAHASRALSLLLRRHLEQLLPEYMVPSCIVVLDTLPLKPTGKLDVAALPPPDTGRPELDGDYVAPQGETERRIAEIWRRLLDVDRISRYDDFFALGGHSLLGTRFVSHLHTEFGVELPLRLVFEQPTVVAIARWVELRRFLGAPSDAIDYEEGEL
ncbi:MULTISPECIES: non-ribosomal peptide synthetase [Sorangium]|nr:MULTISPECIES: non-ribosomal peptide synthetase [Sorangium]